MRTTTLAIDGMHCDGCVQIVQHVLVQQADVKGCSVSLDSQQARFTMPNKSRPVHWLKPFRMPAIPPGP